jgi:hypothetical protein
MARKFSREVIDQLILSLLPASGRPVEIWTNAVTEKSGRRPSAHGAKTAGAGFKGVAFMPGI